MFSKIFEFFKKNLISINDTPHKVALGFGLGVFAGIFPGTGPLASLALAFVFRANRAAALAGALATNTWISFVIFTISLQIGGWLTRTDWMTVCEQGQAVLKEFHWREVFSASTWRVFKPLFAGYLATGAGLGFLVYAMTLTGILIHSRCANRALQAGEAKD